MNTNWLLTIMYIECSPKNSFLDVLIKNQIFLIANKEIFDVLSFKTLILLLIIGYHGRLHSKGKHYEA